MPEFPDLTEQQIDEMKVGPEMDRLVAEHFLGWMPPSRELPEGDYRPMWKESTAFREPREL